jgi:hypothetical protein
MTLLQGLFVLGLLAFMATTQVFMDKKLDQINQNLTVLVDRTSALGLLLGK